MNVEPISSQNARLTSEPAGSVLPFTTENCAITIWGCLQLALSASASHEQDTEGSGHLPTVRHRHPSAVASSGSCSRYQSAILLFESRHSCSVHTSLAPIT